MTIRVTAAIPTLNRGALAADTVRMLRALVEPPDEILLIDQTSVHPAEVEQRLAELEAANAMRWLRLPRPSIPAAMNRALTESSSEIVLFLDDDIIPDDALVREHRAAHADRSVWAVAGQVLQPGEVADGVNPAEPPSAGFEADLDFRFNGSVGRSVRNVMACNLSVKRERAISVGGFDERYVGAAYRFETDFARRLIAAGGSIFFEPRASIRHLKATTGGLRTFGDHLVVASPVHTVGDYYFVYCHASGPERRRYIASRLRKSLFTRFHLRHPWWIPIKLLGELRGWRMGAQSARHEPLLMNVRSDS